jgi:hypothetical protein
MIGNSLIWIGRWGRPAGHALSVRVHVGARRDVLRGEGPLAAYVAAEGEPPAEQGPDPVAVAGQEGTIHCLIFLNNIELPDVTAGLTRDGWF